MISKQHTILEKLSKHQKQIIVCYRPTSKNSWSDRTTFLSENYDEKKPYNHRSILNNEIVIEYDDEDPKVNERYVRIIAQRLNIDKIKYSKSFSGGKSQHCHILININGAMNISLLKNAFIRYYTQNNRWNTKLPLPDMGLCGKRLIRMEYGIHEKTQKHKYCVYTSPGYGESSTIPKEVWDLYDKMYERVQKWKSTTISKELTNSKQVKLILDCVRFNKYGDGRERALFILIHTLKEKYKDNPEGREELTMFLQKWYKSSKGYKLTNVDIKNKVNYHFSRDYNIGISYLSTFLEEIGVKDYD